MAVLLHLRMRTLAALHMATGGYGQAQQIIAARTGVTIGWAQLTGRAHDFNPLRARNAGADLPATDVILMQADGKGIAVRTPIGWPIATGRIEGSCRYIIEDRFGITGARWSPREQKISSNSASSSPTKTSTTT
ncbi:MULTISPECIES: hypothetical protein [unclassified Solwaraspora]|uniref:hypothetical protein n=1 Tax=unclassified Solwaraspora TaxID=2627926 RepID=UPI00248C8732|nr:MULTISPECIES: hypothetical protein [unclassified Solwaraspora]WBC00543.1 hypothetical protein O7553_28880 [Solwaraspora sp. WMMA2059]WBC24057.1 hypothetical protein O7543_18490 [Solwaraspora sp. WMMA2080]WJK38030.1 hypothetical protein O7610_24090 [Solwaraspora sp. WMMA2065]